MEVAVRTRESRRDGGGSQTEPGKISKASGQNQGKKARERWQSEPRDQDIGGVEIQSEEN
jgi:hypothetical protein